MVDDAGARLLGLAKQHREKTLAVHSLALRILQAGDFRRGDMVACLDSTGHEIARGLANYNASETRAIMGSSSRKIKSLLGYQGDDELIHRDNLVLL